MIENQDYIQSMDASSQKMSFYEIKSSGGEQTVCRSICDLEIASETCLLHVHIANRFVSKEQEKQLIRGHSAPPDDHATENDWRCLIYLGLS